MFLQDDGKTLSIHDLCKNCENRDRSSDLMFIHCNTTNSHGYAYSQGYVNVLGEYISLLLKFHGPLRSSTESIS